ncbi:MAG: restriction endonuclease subunit S [Aphanizomenon flos-aquae DEX188]|nr:MAG: restriction endonuclease subunit S [Aphanizomenon flos-aquae DEX188]
MGNYQGYQKYKDSGVEWLGDIPEHWITQKFIRVAFFQEGPGLRNWQFADNGIRVICVTNITDKGIDFSSYQKFIEQEDYEKNYKHFTVKKKDLLLSSSGNSWGKVAEYDSDEIVILNTSTIRINEHENLCVDRVFLKWILQSFCLREQLGLLMTGACQPNFGPSHLAKTIISIPPLNEQEKIAQFLDYKTKQIDELIKKKETLIEKLDEKRTAIISHAVTKGLDSSVPMKDSGVEWLGEIPEHWEKSQLGYLAKVKARLGWKGLTAQEYVNDGYIFLATPNIKNEDYIDFQNVNYITSERYFESPEIMLEKNDILLVKDGSTLGIVNIVRELPSPSTVNSSIAVVRITKKLYSEFLFRWLTGLYIQSLIQLMKGGQGVPHLFQADIKKFFIVIPPFSEQKQIAEYLDQKTTQIDQQKAKIQEAIELLKEYRTSLITNAVTGKIDVSQIAIPSPQKPQPQKG